MAGHLVSSAVSAFHICHGTDVEPAYFWSQGPIVNDVRSWQLIIKHYLTHRFHGPTLCVHPSVRVPHCFRTGPLLEPGSTCEWCQKVAFDYNIKPDFTHLLYLETWCPHQCPGSRLVRAPMFNRPTSGVRVHL